MKPDYVCVVCGHVHDEATEEKLVMASAIGHGPTTGGKNNGN